MPETLELDVLVVDELAVPVTLELEVPVWLRVLLAVKLGVPVVDAVTVTGGVLDPLKLTEPD